MGGSEVKNSSLAYMLPKPRPTEAAEAEPDDAQELEWIREYQFEGRPKAKRRSLRGLLGPAEGDARPVRPGGSTGSGRFCVRAQGAA